MTDQRRPLSQAYCPPGQTCPETYKLSTLQGVQQEMKTDMRIIKDDLDQIKVDVSKVTSMFEGYMIRVSERDGHTEHRNRSSESTMARLGGRIDALEKDLQRVQLFNASNAWIGKLLWGAIGVSGTTIAAYLFNLPNNH